jgi:hypothetical protein
VRPAFPRSGIRKKHVEHVMDKLGVGSRAEIAAWYARRKPPAGIG